MISGEKIQKVINYIQNNYRCNPKKKNISGTAEYKLSRLLNCPDSIVSANSFHEYIVAKEKLRALKEKEEEKERLSHKFSIDFSSMAGFGQNNALNETELFNYSFGNYFNDNEGSEATSSINGILEKLKRLKLDISFYEAVEQWLNKKKINHVEFYNYLEISKQTYSRMKRHLSNPPSKPVALACAVGLELSIDEAKELLEKAGYALSNSNITDVIVKAFLNIKEYDIDLINEAILEFDGTPIGPARKINERK